MARLIATILLLVVAGCTLPQTTIRTGAAAPGLAIKGAPAGAVLLVDGVQVGPASQYNGNPAVLAVLEGVHAVEIRDGGGTIFKEKIFVASGETHVVTIPPKSAK